MHTHPYMHIHAYTDTYIHRTSKPNVHTGISEAVKHIVKLFPPSGARGVHEKDIDAWLSTITGAVSRAPAGSTLPCCSVSADTLSVDALSATLSVKVVSTPIIRVNSLAWGSTN